MSTINNSSSTNIGATTGEAIIVDTTRKNTDEYLKKNNIQDLFSHLLQMVLYSKPENPRQFLRDEVEKMIQTKHATDIFIQDDFATMFDMIDVTKRKTISVDQLRNACRNLSQTGEVDEAAVMAAANKDGRVEEGPFKDVISKQLRSNVAAGLS